MSASKLAELSGMAAKLDETAATAKDEADAKRLHALAEVLKHPVA